VKYTNSIINGDFNIDGVLSDKVGLRQASVLLAIPVAMAGVAILSGILPFAVMADGGRYARLRYYQYLKARDKEQKIDRLLKSFELTKYQKHIIKSTLINI